MKVFYRGSTVIATHSDSDAPDPSAYGENVSILTLPDDFILERIGEPPADLRFDPRPYKLPVVDIGEFKKQGKLELVKVINEFSDKFTSKYPQSEMLSWGTKDTAARAFLAGGIDSLNDSQKLLLNTEREAGGYTDLEALCNVIIENSNGFIRISGTIAGLRVSISDDIDSATTQEGIKQAIDKAKTELANLLKP